MSRDQVMCNVQGLAYGSRRRGGLRESPFWGCGPQRRVVFFIWRESKSRDQYLLDQSQIGQVSAALAVDLDQVEEVLHETSQESIAVLEDPGPYLGREAAYSLRPWCRDTPCTVSIVHGVLEETVGLSRVDHDDTRYSAVAPSSPNNAATHLVVHRPHVNAHLSFQGTEKKKVKVV